MTLIAKSQMSLSRATVPAVLLVVSAFCAACDLSVSNPGPVQDSQLNTPAALPPLVNGMSGDLAVALARISPVKRLRRTS
jgi:hypothetical protein